jgi:hypothetical protein
MGFKNIMASHISKAERARREGGGAEGRGLRRGERERERERRIRVPLRKDKLPQQ